MAFIAAAAPLLSTIGAGVSAVGTVAGGLAAGKTASYNAQIAENNAIAAGQNATYAEEAGAQDTQTQGLKGRALNARVKNAIAANGISVNSGSALDVQESQRETSELDTENVAHKAQLQAYGYRTQQQNFENQAALDKSAAKTAPIAADLGAAGGLLASASSISTKWSGGFGGGSGTDWSSDPTRLGAEY